MTKTEIISQLRESQKMTGDALNQCGRMARDMSDPDASVATLANLMIATTICDMMTNLSLILCEMMPDKILVRSDSERHGMECAGTFPNCQCLTCARDHKSDEHGFGCCIVHKKSCRINQCPDYVKEG